MKRLNLQDYAAVPAVNDDENPRGVDEDQVTLSQQEVDSGQMAARGNSTHDVGGTWPEIAHRVIGGQSVYNTPAVDRSSVSGSGSGSVSSDAWMDDWLSELEAERAKNLETDEDRRKRERREQRDLRWARIADVLGAVHRAYSYGRGIEPNRSVAENMTAKTRERFERAQKQRDARRAAYYQNRIALENLRLSRERERRLRDANALSLRRQEWMEMKYKNQFDLERERMRINEEYNQGRLNNEERRLALAELETWNKFYGTTTQQRVTNSPRGTTTSVTTTTRNPGVVQPGNGGSVVPVTSGNTGGSVTTGQGAENTGRSATANLLGTWELN